MLENSPEKCPLSALLFSNQLLFVSQSAKGTNEGNMCRDVGTRGTRGALRGMEGLGALQGRGTWGEGPVERRTPLE